MKHKVFICEDFKVTNGLLLMWDAEEVGVVDSKESFYKLCDVLGLDPGYNAIVCPDLYQDVEGVKVSGYFFKKSWKSE